MRVLPLVSALLAALGVTVASDQITRAIGLSLKASVLQIPVLRFFASVSEARSPLIAIELAALFAIGFYSYTTRGPTGVESELADFLKRRNAARSGRRSSREGDDPSKSEMKQFLTDVRLLKLFGLSEVLSLVGVQWRTGREDVALDLVRSVSTFLRKTRSLYAPDHLVGQVLGSFGDALEEIRKSSNFVGNLEELRQEMQEINNAARYYFELATDTKLANDFAKIMVQKEWS